MEFLQKQTNYINCKGCYDWYQWERFACGVWCLRFGHPDQAGHNYWKHCCGLGENRVRHASTLGITARKRYFNLLITIGAFGTLFWILMREKPAHCKKNLTYVVSSQQNIQELFLQRWFLDVIFKYQNIGTVQFRVFMKHLRRVGLGNCSSADTKK